MKTHDQLVKAMMKRPGVRAEVDRIEREEAVLLDTLFKARHEEILGIKLSDMRDLAESWAN